MASTSSSSKVFTSILGDILSTSTWSFINSRINLCSLRQDGNIKDGKSATVNDGSPGKSIGNVGLLLLQDIKS
ncbi:hypothetical protein HanIR_Chr14g0689741 [Helianthus annuus]|nr:hypothetical protein HanIR_Chr14g0689741 [Helianthus annuus]